MKKTKVIIPALGMLLISTAASVTGTVAWFTASRNVTVSASNFAVTSLDGNLKAKNTAICGVKTYDKAPTFNSETGAVSNGALADAGHEDFGNVVNAHDFQIGDASFDDTGKILYTDIPSETNGAQPTTYRSLLGAGASGNGWKVSDNADSNQWFAVAWTITLSYEFKDTNDIDIFFDSKDSNATASTGNNNVLGPIVSGTNPAGGNTQKGFRVCMYNDENSLVWAPFRASTETSSYCNKHVDSVSTTAEYANPIYSDTKATALHADKTTINASVKDYFGTISYVDADATTKIGTLDITTVVWFEGCDADVINEATLDTVAANLMFYCRQSATNKAAA